MRGITNAPQGSGGSGGEWSLHTSSNWSDIMKTSGTSIEILKDVIIEDHGRSVFYPKGYVTPANTPLYLPCATFYNTTTPPGLYVARYATVSGGGITGSSVTRTADKYTFTTDGSSITITDSVDSTASYSKSEYLVFTRE